MMRDLPTPNQILEELADKTAAQIDRLAPVAFDRALREVTGYHRFLLALNASQTPDGSPFNYAEVAGNSWSAPHREWIRHYRRLFERAADRLPDNSHFVRSLAYIPRMLLPRDSETELTPDVVKAILDLGPMMMHRIEAWVTRRTTLERAKGESAEPRVALIGSDAKAYENVLPELVGAWEGLLERAPSMYHWHEDANRSDAERWTAFRASWPFIWQHLTNTAYCLAVAVWNEDERGAALFREALVRWPEILRHRLDAHSDLKWPQFLFPDILKLDWSGASERASSLAFEGSPAPGPDQLVATIMRRAHTDVLLLTSALLLFWTVNEKQASDIGGRTAKDLLSRKGGEDGGRTPAERPLSLRSLLGNFVRFEVAAGRYVDGTYAAELDRLVETLDNMTERRVVPGRVFTPSTLHGRDDLLLPVLAILIAATPKDGDDSLGSWAAELAGDDRVLPEGDLSLRNIVRQLERFRTTLEQAWDQLERGTAILQPDQENKRAGGRLRDIVGSVEGTIEAARSDRLKNRPVDHSKLERIRVAIEAGLMSGGTGLPFFRQVLIERSEPNDAAELRELTFEVSKAQLVEPAMDSEPEAFEGRFASACQRRAGDHVWRSFTCRPRIRVEVKAPAEQELFWKEIANLADQVGPDPILIVSRAAEGRTVRRFKYRTGEAKPDLRIEHRPNDERDGSYIATVEGVDVYGAEFPAGTAWLFSQQALESVQYAALDHLSRLADVEFDAAEDLKGTLRVRFRQHLEWANTPIFEIMAPDPDELEEGAAS
jgi:exonuclease VII small subunit